MLGISGLTMLKPLASSSVLFAGQKSKHRSIGGFTPALGEKTLDRLERRHMKKMVFDIDPAVMQSLQPGDQKALVHLIKAAQALDAVFLKQDHPQNIAIKAALSKASGKGDSYATKLLRFFDSFNSAIGYNRLTNKPVHLISGVKATKGLGLYPPNITHKQLVSYLLKHPEQAAAILSNDTIVVRSGKRLEAIPYAVAFRKEYEAAARELQHAALASTNKPFSNYLKLQAAALVSPDPVYAYQADEAWAKLEDTPLEFTIGRESYGDELTAAVASDAKLAPVLAELGIAAKSKDFIGVRVGVVNREGQALFAKYRSHLHEVAEQVPRSKEYAQDFDGVTDASQIRQAMVDVDLVYLSGDYASKKTGITLAQNLPNDDKIYTTLGGGRRNVFHRSIRMAPPSDPTLLPKLLEASVAAEQREWYNDQVSDHLVTIGHELGHSLGPKTTASGADKKAVLGGYGDIIEENKADIMSIFMTDHLVKQGKLTPDEANSIYLTWAFDNFPLREPKLSQTYPVRSVMQAQYFIQRGAFIIDESKRLKIVPEKMHETARAMLSDIVDIQLEGSESKAKAYVERYFVWDDTMAHFSKTRLALQKNPKVFIDVIQPTAERLLKGE